MPKQTMPKQTMPKQLIIIRHAKSAWDDAALSDFDRPLNDRGRKDAPRMAKWLVDSIASQHAEVASARIKLPAAWLVSPAKRTQQTKQHFWQQFWQQLRIQVTDNQSADVTPTAPLYWEQQCFYLGSVTEWSRALAQLPNVVQCAAIIGHNPGLSMLASELAQRTIELSTCELVVLNLDVDDWSELTSLATAATVLVQQRPKTLT